ncbi:MAG: hypothetical protein ACRC5W_02655 [Cetobacterium sp.]
MDELVLSYYCEKVKEGGMARNLAFHNYFKKENKKIINLYSRYRLISILKLIYLILILKNKKIFLHGNIFISLLGLRYITLNLYIFFIERIIKRFSIQNKLIIEINDLNYEQAIDLNLRISKDYEGIEMKVLYNNIHNIYIYASKLMMEYAMKKYKLDEKKVFFILNGGINLEDIKSQKTKKLKFVYAGSLKRGKSIDKMLEIFKKLKHTDLYLLGEGGESLNINSENIYYLGNLEEKEAHNRIKEFDIGIIPYDQNKLYYNLCYPTKASFYITAGLPILSTDLKELRQHFDETICIFKNIEDWEKIIENLTLNNIKEMKKSVLEVNKKYTWDFLLKKLEEII